MQRNGGKRCPGSRPTSGHSPSPWVGGRRLRRCFRAADAGGAGQSVTQERWEEDASVGREAGPARQGGGHSSGDICGAASGTLSPRDGAGTDEILYNLRACRGMNVSQRILDSGQIPGRPILEAHTCSPAAKGGSGGGGDQWSGGLCTHRGTPDGTLRRRGRRRRPRPRPGRRGGICGTRSRSTPARGRRRRWPPARRRRWR